MGKIYGAVLGLLAIVALLRVFTWATHEERQSIRGLCTFLWVFLGVEVVMDYSALRWNLGAGRVFDLAWSVPFLVAGGQAAGLPLLLAPRRWVMRFGRFWARCVLALLRAIVGLDGEVRGLEHIPSGPSIIAMKHQSAWDTLILPLILDEGRLNPTLDNGEWGATVGGAVLVWRSGIGVDRGGNLIYAAGNNQTVRSLAATLKHAGAVRAMELDINSYWVSFITYGAPSARRPANLLTDMNRSASRYLEPDDRDFFAVYAR